MTLQRVPALEPTRPLTDTPPLDAPRRTVDPVRWNRWLRAARPHQWIKATLVLTAPLVALELSFAVTLRVLAAAALACLAASGTYLLNDALDVEADRLHPVKRSRPVAAGEVSPRQAIRVAVVLLIAAPLLGLLLSPGTAIALAGYVAVTVAYSLRLKRIAVGDVLAISAGFVLRVLIGSAATSTRVAPWFLVSVAAGAVMVATGKRRGELRELGAGAVTHRSSLLTYQDPVTTKLLAVAAAALCCGLVGWATIGGGGPHLAESWACALLAPTLFGVGRYLRLAMSGRAARPERLVRDRWLIGCALLTITLFLAGRALS